MAEHERDRLNDRLQGEQDAGGGLLAFAERADEIRVRHVVNVGDEHGNGGGDPERNDQTGNGRFGHVFIILVGFACHAVISFSHHYTPILRGLQIFRLQKR